MSTSDTLTSAATLQVLQLHTTEGKKDYNKAMEEVGGSYPHFSLGFMESFTGALTDAFALVYRNNTSGGVVVMPMFIKNIQFENGMQALDVSSPYGYYGPLHNAQTAKDDLQQFWAEADATYKKMGVVSEFIRFNLDPNTTAYNGEVVHTLNNIKGQILPTADAQWAAYDTKARRNIRLASELGYQTQFFYQNISREVFDEFYEIYVHTMQRNSATDYFYFPDADMLRYVQQNPAHVMIATTYDGSLPIASEFILVQHDTIYSFLGGTLASHIDQRPNHLLKHHIIEWARAEGKSFYVLGGGYGKNDGIYIYKKSFFPKNVVEYYTGRKIVDPEKYQALVTAANAQRLTAGLEPLSAEEETFFPLYRKLK